MPTAPEHQGCAASQAITSSASSCSCGRYSSSRIPSESPRAAQVDAHARVAVRGEVRVVARVAHGERVALAVGQVLEQRRDRALVGVLGQPQARGQPRPVGHRDPGVVDSQAPHCVRSAYDDALHVHERRLLGGRPQRVRGPPGPRAGRRRRRSAPPPRGRRGARSRARCSTGRTRRATAPSRAARTRPRRRSPSAPSAAARAAAPGWRRTPYGERCALLRAVARGIGERHLELAAVASLEVGKTRAESIAEVQEAIDLIEAYAGHMEANDGYVAAARGVGGRRAQHRRAAPLRHVRRARAVQLPRGAVVRHDRRGADRGQHGGLQALGGDAVDGRDPGRDLRRCRACRPGCSTSCRAARTTGRALVGGRRSTAWPSPARPRSGARSPARCRRAATRAPR